MPDLSFYPPNPLSVNPGLTVPAASFRKQVIRVIGAIILFCFVYLLLLLMAAGLAALCIMGGVFLIVNMPKLITLILGLGIIGVGVMVLIFLIKFVFARQSHTNPNRVEIFEEDHPDLFAFIRQLTIDTNTPMPRKVFIVQDVNAAVFYNSSFWSMFLPVRKNLEIGLGLVNVLNLSEFKMVLAHEFGHFSQRSMKLGSYVFTMNKAIYNMLYENSGYDKTLNAWANIHSIFALTATLTVWIARLIQSVLRGMYSVINLQYMSLSREMEFHADAVAVSVTGSDIATSAMRRIEYVNGGMNYCINKAGELAGNNSAMQNMFETQRRVNHYFADINQIAMVDGLPHITNECLSKFTGSRLKYKDQWATHPSMEEREERFRLAGVENAADNRSAWVLFSDKTGLEESMTRHYFSVNFPDAEIKEMVDSETLIDSVKEYRQLYEFPAAFNDYYDNRSFQPIDPDRIVPDAHSFAERYDPAVVQRIKRYFQNMHDLACLQAMERKEIDVKYFQFDQQHHTLSEAGGVIKELESEIETDKQWLLDMDHAAFRFHQQNAAAAAELKQAYEHVIALQEEAGQLDAIVQKILGRINYLYQVQQFSLETLKSELDTLKADEQAFREALEKIRRSGVVEPAVDKTFAEDAATFLGSQAEYMKDDVAQGPAIVALYELANRTAVCFSRAIERKRKHYLEMAAS
ncbi:M48 family metalloprotease [Chitinophaga cymbidii]|uniref:Peptidase M48 domain-containing protein n=1 Tax=Chitinophaga cymbidii TaxID=1096750 RepID=A0A512RMZ6_9BACT|nr:M48 family metallopeptidase [Chitinophaga cymbidii]GEP97086.1 hypothetical protein CCY01nite_33460 [Chitinophaga cymbidii]